MPQMPRRRFVRNGQLFIPEAFRHAPEMQPLRTELLAGTGFLLRGHVRFLYLHRMVLPVLYHVLSLGARLEPGGFFRPFVARMCPVFHLLLPPGPGHMAQCKFQTRPEVDKKG